MHLEGEDELFGSALPSGYRPRAPAEAEQDAGGSVRALREARQAQAALFAGGDPERGGEALDRARRRRAWSDEHHARTKQLYDEMGWLNVRCDQALSFRGAKIKKDLFGIGDRIAIRRGVVALLQLTTKAAVGAHVQKIANPSNLIEKGKTPIAIREYADRWLAEGGEIHIVGWHQPEGPGKRWRAAITKVTPELLAEADKRRRGPQSTRSKH